MGFAIIEVEDIDSLSVSEDNIFLGSIEFVQAGMKKLGFEVPEHNDYPQSQNIMAGK